MNVAIFGGTFDPVHRGHLAVARAAARRFHLQRIYFVPANSPPHKRTRPIAPFDHRYAMLALATAGERRFVPSLMEAQENGAADRANYSIKTVRRFRRLLGARDRLFFIIGIDAFLEISTWREPEALLREAEFIVAGRPGYSLEDVAAALPASIREEGESPRRGATRVKVANAVIHLLPETRDRASATEIRAAAARGKKLGAMVPKRVAEYIEKMHLYKAGTAGQPEIIAANGHHQTTGGH